MQRSPFTMKLYWFLLVTICQSLVNGESMSEMSTLEAMSNSLEPKPEPESPQSEPAQSVTAPPPTGSAPIYMQCFSIQN